MLFLFCFTGPLPSTSTMPAALPPQSVSSRPRQQTVHDPTQFASSLTPQSASFQPPQYLPQCASFLPPHQTANYPPQYTSSFHPQLPITYPPQTISFQNIQQLLTRPKLSAFHQPLPIVTHSP